MRIFLLISLLFVSIKALAQINIVASIKPIHSIASAITQNVGKVDVLLDTQQSAHFFHLKPSQMALINRADLVIAVHPKLEEGLDKALKSLNPGKLLYVVNNDASSTINQKKINYHAWLNVDNMQQFAYQLTSKLSALYPDKKSIFLKNFEQLKYRLQQLKAHNKQQLNQLNNAALISYSNALDPYIDSMGLNHIGSVVDNHHQKLSVKTMLKARKLIKANKARCLVSTKEISSKRTQAIAEGFNIRHAHIDIIGFEFDKGAQLYFKLINAITAEVKSCLQ